MAYGTTGQLGRFYETASLHVAEAYRRRRRRSVHIRTVCVAHRPYSRQWRMGAGTWAAGWATAHPGENQGGPCPPWKYQP